MLPALNRHWFADRTDNDLAGALREWCREKGLCWATSVTAHLLCLSLGMLLVGFIYSPPRREGESPAFESVSQISTAILDDDPTPDDILIDIQNPPGLTDALQPETIGDLAPPSLSDSLPSGDLDASPVAAGIAGLPTGPSLPRFPTNVSNSGPSGPPPSATGGSGGPGGYGWRGGDAQWRPGTGSTKPTQQSVALALRWIARHQSLNGSWSLENFAAKCSDATCTGAGSIKSDSAASSLALLPFLAAGQTHRHKGPYQKTIADGLYWLQKQQTADGDLSAGSEQQMYTHALAAIAMSEAFGMTGDRNVGAAAQQAIHFIERAQHQESGGWRYTPRVPGDTSVVGWQVMALKSAQMAGLTVSTQTMDGVQRWLKSTSNGSGQFAYQPGGGGTPAVSSVGLLCTQYMGAPRNDRAIQGGQAFLLGNLPNTAQRDTYYWYYATQVMHNLEGPEWDTWNRAMRRLLIETQIKTGCAAGSWSPDTPTKDAWGAQGGRLMMTSLSCLTLEVYYRYLPLYKNLSGRQNNFDAAEAICAASPSISADNSDAAKSVASRTSNPAGIADERMILRTY